MACSQAWFSPASFRRTDHLGDPQVPLADAVRNLVERADRLAAGRPDPPADLLALLRLLLQSAEPVLLLRPPGQTVEAVVAEVSNTPWRERHWYVLSQGNRIGEPSQLRFRHPKEFHVSPFMDMDMLYDWHLHDPGPQLSVEIANSRGERAVVRGQPGA